MSRLTHRAGGAYVPPVPREKLMVTSADGARLYAEIHGPQGAPAVVLSHGWTCSTAFWAPVVRDLAADHRVVLYDQRGHGRTPAVRPGGYGTGALADDLVAVLEATLGTGERTVLGGHSLGGMTLMAAAGRPQLRARAAAALLCSTGSAGLATESRVVPLRHPGLRRRVHRAMLGSRAPLGPVTPLGKRILRYVTMGAGATAEQLEACARIVHACPPVVRSHWGKVLYRLELTGGAARLDVPTAVLTGTADRLTPLVHARRLASVLPDCRGLTELPGLGHMTPLEDPGAVAGLLRELVQEHLAPRTGVPAPQGERTPQQKQHKQQKQQKQSAQPQQSEPSERQKKEKAA
ncbi:alpha/beta fold hydrolase [Streptomyces celluloflavus]|uniref:alpha/beta fold hydrolase n=1 Tax=Streptomyces celluloflavus TaxID=58344 RepID=UPI0036D9A7E5